MLSSTSSLAFALLLVVTLTGVLPLVSCSRDLVGVATDRALEDPLLMMEKFHGWMAKHGKSYTGVEEKLRRFDIYRRNVEFIEAANRDGRLTYTLGANQFADLTHEEFLARHTNRRVVPSEKMVITTRAGDVVEDGSCRPASNAVPDSIDWVKQHKVTQVKSQGQKCGACWAFSAVATIESAYAIAKGGTPPVLSEQELIDCDTFDRGCTSGEMHNAYLWVMRNGGIATNSTYPYKETKGTCERRKLQEHAATIREYELVEPNCEEQLMAAVAVRPVAVGFDSNDECFRFYQAGLYDGMCIKHGEYVGPCSSNDRIHSLAIVGYAGKGGDKDRYWIAKNSWSKDWGNNGYVLLRKDVDKPEGLCGLAVEPVYPIA